MVPFARKWLNHPSFWVAYVASFTENPSLSASYSVGTKAANYVASLRPVLLVTIGRCIANMDFG
jgi:hypothetical protein